MTDPNPLGAPSIYQPPPEEIPPDEVPVAAAPVEQAPAAQAPAPEAVAIAPEANPLGAEPAPSLQAAAPVEQAPAEQAPPPIDSGGPAQALGAPPVYAPESPPAAEPPGGPLSGVVGAVQNVSEHLGNAAGQIREGDVGGALGEVLAISDEPREQATNQATRRSATGETIDLGDTRSDPSAATDIYATESYSPSLVGDVLPDNPGGILGRIGDLITYDIYDPVTKALGIVKPPNPADLGVGIGSRIVGSELTDWIAANPDAYQQAMDAGGEQAVIEAWKQSGGASSMPPPEWVNPVDGAGNPLQVAGNLIQTGGGIKDSLQAGTLGPFLKGAAVDLAADPLGPVQAGLSLAGGLAIPAAARLGEAGIAPGIARGLRAVNPIGQSINAGIDIVSGDPTALGPVLGAITPPDRSALSPRRLTDPTQLGREGLTRDATMQAVTEYLATDPLPPGSAGTLPTSGVVPATRVTPGVGPPPPNGALVPPTASAATQPNLRQPVAAAPPISPVGTNPFQPYSFIKNPPDPTTGRSTWQVTDRASGMPLTQELPSYREAIDARNALVGVPSVNRTITPSRYTPTSPGTVSPLTGAPIGPTRVSPTAVRATRRASSAPTPTVLPHVASVPPASAAPNPGPAIVNPGTTQQQRIFNDLGLSVGPLRERLRQVIPEDAEWGWGGRPVSPTTNKALHDLTDVHFRDGSRATGKPLGEHVDRINRDLDAYLGQVSNPPTSGKAKIAFDKLAKTFDSPDYPIDWERLARLAASSDPATITAARLQKGQIAGRVLQDAVIRGAPKVAKKTGLVPNIIGAVQAFNSTRGMVQLFNYANVLRYTTQQIIGNTVTGLLHPSTIPPMWRRIRDLRLSLQVNAGTKFDPFVGLETQAGLGHIGTVETLDRAQVGALANGKLPPAKGAFAKAARLLVPQKAMPLMSLGDNGFRKGIAEASLNEAFRVTNTAMPQILSNTNKAVPKRLGMVGSPFTDQHYTEFWDAFLDRHSTRLDPNTGAFKTTSDGALGRYEPLWSPTDLRTELRDHLEGVLKANNAKIDAPLLNGIIYDAHAEAMGHVEVTRRYITDQVNTLAFSWVPTNVSEGAKLVMMYPYWSTKAGLLYTKYMLTHPVAMATYGRMMDDLEQQNMAMNDGEANWLSSFLRMINSPAGMTVMYSPPDMISTLLTAADWMESTGGDARKDLTLLGKLLEHTPFQVMPLLQYGLYATGALGPDAAVPDVLGINRFSTLTTNLLNEAQSHGLLGPLFTDAYGNPQPINVKPLQQLYATLGGHISEVVTQFIGHGDTVNVLDGNATYDREINLVLEQNLRITHPEASQIEIANMMAVIKQEPGSPELLAAQQQVADSKFQVTGPIDTPLPDFLDAVLGSGVVQGLARIASPIAISSAPEQLMLDSRLKTMPTDGSIPPRLPVEDDPDTPWVETGKLKGNALDTPEAQILNADMRTYWETVFGGSGGRYDTLLDIYYAGEDDGEHPIRNVSEPVTVGGVTYTPDELAGLDKESKKAIARQYAADLGTTWDDLAETAKAGGDPSEADTYAANNERVAGYLEFREPFRSKDLEEGEALDNVVALMNENPAYADYVMHNAIGEDGQINPIFASTEEAYLASIGVRPGLYDPLNGPPTTANAGYVAPEPDGQRHVTPGAETAIINASDGLNLRAGPGAENETIDLLPGDTTVEITEKQGEWWHVTTPDGGDGWVSSAYLKKPAAAPSASGPMDAIGSVAQGLAQGVGSLIDAAGSVVGTMVGNAPQETVGTKPAQGSAGSGWYDVVPANDGMGVQSTIKADRTWMEDMIGPGTAYVTTEYKGDTPVGVSYDYQIGHDADGTTHAAYDISCETPAPGQSTCNGTPIYAPMDGTVICPGYGVGESTMPGATCNYSLNTTTYNDDGSDYAHTITIEVGKDENGNSIQLSFNHMGTSDLVAGQAIHRGDLVGGMGNGACDTGPCPHVHLEGQIADPALGYRIVDPTLIVGGYYTDEPVISAPVQGASPAYEGTAGPMIDLG